MEYFNVSNMVRKISMKICQICSVDFTVKKFLINNELKNQVKKDLDIEKITASILANRGIEGPDLAVFLDLTIL